MQGSKAAHRRIGRTRKRTRMRPTGPQSRQQRRKIRSAAADQHRIQRSGEIGQICQRRLDIADRVDATEALDVDHGDRGGDDHRRQRRRRDLRQQIAGGQEHHDQRTEGDTMEQVRVPIAELPARVAERVGWSTLFS